LQENIEAGLADFASSVNSAVEEFKVSPTGQQLRADVEDFHERVKTGDVENKARQELASLLRSINSELEKVSKQRDTENEVEGNNVEES
jgi:hypothetical protein